MTNPPDVMTIDELCEYLRVSPPTIRLWIRGHGLPCKRLSRKIVRFVRAEVDRWLKEKEG